MQETFNELAALFGVAAPRSAFYETGGRYWELAPFLDEHQVFHYTKDHLFDIYPTAAAFGDFIGLGDRHFENYISRGDQLIAIDVSHLMEPDNELWTKKYISGGLYECCLLQYYVTDVGQFDQYLTRFFKGYEAASGRLVNRLDTGGNDASGQLS